MVDRKHSLPILGNLNHLLCTYICVRGQGERVRERAGGGGGGGGGRGREGGA